MHQWDPVFDPHFRVQFLLWHQNSQSAVTPGVHQQPQQKKKKQTQSRWKVLQRTNTAPVVMVTGLCSNHSTELPHLGMNRTGCSHRAPVAGPAVSGRRCVPCAPSPSRLGPLSRALHNVYTKSGRRGKERRHHPPEVCPTGRPAEAAWGRFCRSLVRFQTTEALILPVIPTGPVLCSLAADSRALSGRFGAWDGTFIGTAEEVDLFTII